MVSREYLRKLIMETIYVSPSGQAMKRDEWEEFDSVSPEEKLFWDKMNLSEDSFLEVITN